MKKYILTYIDKFKNLFLLILFILTLSSFNYEPNIIEPFNDYKVEQPYNNSPNKAPKAIDWNSLNYDDPLWGWYYKQLWYLYHPNSTDTPPWMIPTSPLNDELICLLMLSTIFLIYKYILIKRTDKMSY